MWFQFDSIEYRTDLVSKAGKTYSAYVLKGTKKGFDKDPDEPYEKKVFDDSATTIIEQGIERPNCSIVQFFQKAVQPGDTIIIKYVRGRDGMWNIESLQKLGENKAKPTYEPMTEEQLSALKSAPAAAVEAYNSTPPWARG